jgi:hypothetical protein
VRDPSRQQLNKIHHRLTSECPSDSIKRMPPFSLATCDVCPSLLSNIGFNPVLGLYKGLHLMGLFLSNYWPYALNWCRIFLYFLIRKFSHIKQNQIFHVHLTKSHFSSLMNSSWTQPHVSQVQEAGAIRLRVVGRRVRRKSMCKMKHKGGEEARWTFGEPEEARGMNETSTDGA